MHKAADYAQECIRNLSFEGEQVYILKADIHKYFNSVDHEVLKQILGGIFKDKDLLKLLYYIIDSYGEDGRGGLSLSFRISEPQMTGAGSAFIPISKKD